MGECFQAIAANVAPLPSLIAWDPDARQKSEISWLRRLRRTCANSTVCGLVRSAQGVWQGEGGHCIPSWSAEGSQATLARFLCWPESIHPYPCLPLLCSTCESGSKGQRASTAPCAQDLRRSPGFNSTLYLSRPKPPDPKLKQSMNP